VRDHIKEKKWASKCYITIHFRCYDLKTTPPLKDSKGKKKNKSKETIRPTKLDLDTEEDNNEDNNEDIDTSLDHSRPSITKNQLKAKRASNRRTNRVKALRQLIFAKHTCIKERCKN
jgi:hypothetical protein